MSQSSRYLNLNFRLSLLLYSQSAVIQEYFLQIPLTTFQNERLKETFSEGADAAKEDIV
jgi:hypothetical protein